MCLTAPIGEGRSVNYNLLLLLVSTGVGVVAGATAIYAGQSPTRSGTAATLIAGLAATLGAIIVVVAKHGADRFGILHLGYLILVIGVPLAGLGLAINWKNQQFLGRTVAVLALLVAPVGIYATHIEPFWLRVDEVRLPSSPSVAGLRIGVLADLQATTIDDYERGAIDELIEARPDLVLIPGDLWQMPDSDFATQAPLFTAELARLSAAIPNVFVVKGHTDTVDGLRQLTTGTSVVVLDNEVIEVEIAGRSIRIGGITLDGDEATAQAAIATLVAPPAPDRPAPFRILLAHKPDEIDRLPGDDSVNVIVSGHTHGGQIRLPWLPPPITLSSVPRTVGGGGLHRLDDHWIYVSTGVGRERGRAPQVRFGVRPSIGIITAVDALVPVPDANG
jgi:predicted MPP superfamily phosphohydrolase